MDPPTKAILDTIRSAGYAVYLHHGEGKCAMYATHKASGHTYVVRGDDPYRVAVELAREARIELEDG